MNHEMPQMVASSYNSSTIDNAAMMNLMARLRPNAVVNPQHQHQAILQQAKAPIPMATQQRRLVQIFIADPDENVPLDQCLLYSGEQKLTDLTDQELFFEMDVKSLLDKHNAERVKLVNKSVKERTEHLEVARVRDLKMTVVTIAQF